MPNSRSAVVRPASARRRNPIPPAVRPAGPRAALVEALEGRQLLSVVYVSSSSGRDTNTGRSEAAAVRSIAKAKSLLRNGDQLLLKRGDAWRESLGGWNWSSTTISAYGVGNRPQVLTTQNGIQFGRGVANVTVRGVSLVAPAPTSSQGAILNGTQSNITFENVEIDGFRNNVTAQGFYGPIYNLTIRDSLITDSRPVGGHSAGLYADGVRGITLERNVFDGNGGQGSPFNHGAYVTALSTNLVARDNVFSNSSSHGMQARGGGVITGNAFLNNSIGLSVGLVNGGGTHVDGGVTATVTGNVFSGSGSLRDRGVGVELGNVKSGVVSDNLFLNGSAASPNAAIVLAWGNAKGRQVGINNLQVTNNVVYKWGRGIQVAYGFGGSGAQAMRNLLVANNDFQEIYTRAVEHKGGYGGETWRGNRAWGKGGVGDVRGGGVANVRVAYPDASRSVQKYDAGFVHGSRAKLGAKYTAAGLVAYLKGGFKRF